MSVPGAPLPLPHPCRVPGCQALVETQRPVCGVHWRLVPAAMHKPMWRAWLVGRAAWESACAEVVEHVVRAEAERDLSNCKWRRKERRGQADTRVSAEAE